MAIRTPSARRSSPAPADVITYRLNNKMMYVPPAQSFDQAVTFARSAYESDLNGVDQSQICFSLNVIAQGRHSSVGITSEAWPSVVSRLARYEIIDLHVTPAIKVSPPPSYRSGRSSSPAEKPEKGHRSSSHSSSKSASQSSSHFGGLPGRLIHRLSH
ncbi:hypothetical protein M405DRAFT_735320 [Rhizopogon salebrosus TDB-379]|nr:hypothetical protein M405DRAFT_735320 [Rhizopogon salebrosus TDB-379]